MKRRARRIAGLAGSIVFGFSLIVGIRASMCATDIEVGASALAPATPPSNDEPTPDHDCMGHDGDEGRSHCPFTAVGAGASCVSAPSLPAAVVELASPAERDLRLFALESTPYVVKGPSLFHPPRS